MRIIIKNAYLIDPGADREGIFDILVENGRIKEVGKGLTTSGDEVIDAKDKFVFPGAFDIHTHLREPGEEHKETIETGTKAGAHGGCTSALCMANTKITCDSESVVRYILERPALIRIFPVGAITKGLKGEEIAPIGMMVRAGAKAISDDGRTVMNSLVLRRAMEYAKVFRVPVIEHCEEVNLTKGGCVNEGKIALRWGLGGMPSCAEEIIVARDIALAKFTSAHLHIAHVSCKEALSHIKKAKAHGIKVTCEVAIHHLILTEDDFVPFDTSFKVNPPLRTREDRNALREALSDTIDCIVSDHAPHSFIEKEVEFENAAFGISSADFFLPLAWTQVVEGVISPKRLVELVSLNPARILGIEGIGSLKEGNFADLVIFDPDGETFVTESNMFSKGKNCPYKGRVLKGKIVLTMVEGKIVYKSSSSKSHN